MNLASVFHHQAVKHPAKLAIRDADMGVARRYG